jgi:hypothetical protein
MLTNLKYQTFSTNSIRCVPLGDNKVISTRKRLTLADKNLISQNLESNQDFKDFVVGQLLGDGNLSLNGNEANFRFAFKNSIYAQYIWDYFNSLGIVGAPVKEYSYLDKRTNKSYTSYRIATFSLPFFTAIHKEWYKNFDSINTKIVPLDLLSKFSPIVLAKWLEGDGTFNQRAQVIILCTNSFTLTEVKSLINILFEKYEISSSIVNQRDNQYLIRIPKKSLIKVQTLVQHHMHPSMMYRVGL